MFLFQIQLVVLLAAQTVHFLHFMFMIPHFLDSLKILQLQKQVARFLSCPLQFHPLKVPALKLLSLPKILQPQAQFIPLIDSLVILLLQGRAPHFLDSLELPNFLSSLRPPHFLGSLEIPHLQVLVAHFIRSLL